MNEPSSPTAARAPRMRVARGPKRPDYLGDPDLDRLMMMFTALMQEVSALRDRIDTHELLAAADIVATAEAIDAFELPAEHVARRSAMREALLQRVLRVMFEELEAAGRAEAFSPAEVDAAQQVSAETPQQGDPG